MHRPVAAELHIACETSTTYRVLYRQRSEPGAAVTPWYLHGRDTLRVFLQQFESAWKIEGVPPFTRGVIGHEIGLALARELRPLVPGHPWPLSSPQRIPWHVCGGRRGQDGCDRTDAV